LLLDARAETRWASGRRWIVADAPGRPAGALDIELAQIPEDRVLDASRDLLTPISLSVDVEPSNQTHACLLARLFHPTSRVILNTTLDALPRGSIGQVVDVCVYGDSPRLTSSV